MTQLAVTRPRGGAAGVVGGTGRASGRFRGGAAGVVGGTGRASGRSREERGSAIVEFYFLGIVLLVPLVYIMVTLLDVQRTAYGVTQAAREAGRLFAATGDEDAALTAATLVLEDQGVEPSEVDLAFECTTEPCYAPGGEITVTVAATVQLPLVPDVFADTVNAEIPVRGTHAAPVDRYWSTQ